MFEEDEVLTAASVTKVTAGDVEDVEDDDPAAAVAKTTDATVVVIVPPAPSIRTLDTRRRL